MSALLRGLFLNKSHNPHFTSGVKMFWGLYENYIWKNQSATWRIKRDVGLQHFLGRTDKTNAKIFSDESVSRIQEE